MTLRRATERLREVGSLPLLLIALLIAMSGDLSAQDRSRSRSNDSSDHGGRTATPRADSSPPRSSPSPSTPPRSASPSSPSSPSYDPPSSSPSRRRAVPGTPGEGRRQPPSRDRRDPDWRGDGGRWHGHGGSYYPRWYRYYGGPSWWWTPYGYWGWWWLGDNYWPYDPYYYNRPYYRDHGYSSRDGEVGALDLDLSPGRTQVYLDGQYLGTVDQYDGFPTYLWLEKGTYDIAFYLDGYKTLARQVSVYPGTVIDMEDRMEPGQSVRPEDLLGPKTHERRDAREKFERERRERIERGEDPYDEDEEWRDRVRRGREDRRDRGEEIEIEDDDGRSEQGRVRLEVEPNDASIYLDGQFVGTAEDLANLRRGLLVEPGKHNVAVVRPGRESVEREFEVDPGEELELEIELEPESR